jgi:hypothetical protein
VLRNTKMYYWGKRGYRLLMPPAFAVWLVKAPG